MATTSSLTHTHAGDGNHTITMHVAFDPGGGPPGTADVTVTLRWDPAVLENPSNVAPAAGPAPVITPGGGVVIWQSATVDVAGTDFKVQLSCKATQAPVSTVVAGVCEEVGTSRSKTLTVGVLCG